MFITSKLFRSSVPLLLLFAVFINIIIIVPEITPERCETISQFVVTKLSAITHTINNQLSSLCLPLLAVQTFHKSPILIAFRPVTVWLLKSLFKHPHLTVFQLLWLNRVVIFFSVLLAYLTNLSFAENIFSKQVQTWSSHSDTKETGSCCWWSW